MTVTTTSHQVRRGRGLARESGNGGRTGCGVALHLVVGLMALAASFAAARAEIHINQDWIGTDTWTLSNSPYIVHYREYSHGGPIVAGSLTIEAGVVVKFQYHASLIAGTGGSIHANGTEAQPILFTDEYAEPEARNWAGIKFARQSAASDLTWCTIEKVGWVYGEPLPRGALCSSANLQSFSHCTFRNNNGYGAYVTGEGNGPPWVSFTDCAFENNTSTDIYLWDGRGYYRPVVSNCTFSMGSHLAINVDGYQPIEPLITNCVFNGPGYNAGGLIYTSALRVPLPSALDATVNLDQCPANVGATITSGAVEQVFSTPLPPLPGGRTYYIESGLAIFSGWPGPVGLRLDPGVRLAFGVGKELHTAVNGAMVDSVLVAAGTETAPVVFTSATGNADWKGIWIEGGRARLNNCVIEKGGAYRQPNTNGGLVIMNAAPTITNCEFRDNIDYHIFVGDFTDPQIHWCSFLGAPQGYPMGVARANPSNLINALNNWWGDATGPCDPEGGYDYNPDGLGVRVADQVAYRPWLPRPAASVPPEAPGADGMLVVRPNPARDRCELAFRLPEAQQAALRIFDAGGRLVRTLADAPMSAGDHVLLWDGRTDQGRAAGSGTYFTELTIAGRRTNQRVLVVR